MYNLFMMQAWRYYDETTLFSLYILNTIPPEFASSFTFIEPPANRILPSIIEVTWRMTRKKMLTWYTSED